MKYQEAQDYYNEHKEEIKKDDSNFAKQVVKVHREDYLYSNYTSMFSFALTVKMYKEAKENRCLRR